MVIKKYEGKNVTIDIDEDKCIGAGECVKACPESIFELVDGKAQATSIEDCSECCACVEACPTKAIQHSSC
jgi:NAD-dependent dihydropyrimidine dehydrogenase PreA subunit